MAELTGVKDKLIADVLSALDANLEKTAANAAADATLAWPKVSNDDAYSEPRVIYHIEQATIDVITAVVNAPNHPSAGQFMTASPDLSYGDVLPIHIGSPGRVLVKSPGGSGTFKQAFPRDLQAVTTMHDLAIVVRDLYYFITPDNAIYFTGITSPKAQVWLAQVDMTDVQDSAFYDSIPGELLDAITAKALYELYARGGDMLNYRDSYGREWESILARWAKG